MDRFFDPGVSGNSVAFSFLQRLPVVLVRFCVVDTGFFRSGDRFFHRLLSADPLDPVPLQPEAIVRAGGKNGGRLGQNASVPLVCHRIDGVLSALDHFILSRISHL